MYPTFFDEIGPIEGLKLIIEGCHLDGFEWRGIGHQYLHMQTIFESAAATKELVISYEDLVFEKDKVIKRLADYLSVSDYDQEGILKTTSIDAMRNMTANKSHFNRGVVGRIFDSEFEAVHRLLENVSANYMAFDGYEYLTNFDELRRLVSEKI